MIADHVTDYPTSEIGTLELEAGMLRLFGDVTRLRIIDALSHGPRPVNGLCEELHVPQPTVSRHLRALREGAVVVATRHGAFVEYRLRDHHVLKVLDSLRRYLAVLGSRDTAALAQHGSGRPRQMEDEER